MNILAQQLSAKGFISFKGHIFENGVLKKKLFVKEHVAFLFLLFFSFLGFLLLPRILHISVPHCSPARRATNFTQLLATAPSAS